MEVPDGLRQSPRWWHDPGGAAWLDGLPALVADVCARWDLRVDGATMHGSNALVVPVVAPSGPAALRLTPADARAAAELRALRFWAGAPVVGLLRAEPDGSVLLLERLEASGPLAERPVDEVAATIGDLVRRLALPDPPGDVPSTAEAARALVEDGPRRWQTLGRPLPVAVLDSAVELARSLSDRAPSVAVDGDVHAGQVLRASEGGAWTVVDPLLMRGDPGYDLARSLWTLVDGCPTGSPYVATPTWSSRRRVAAPSGRGAGWSSRPSTTGCGASRQGSPRTPFAARGSSTP